MELWIRSQDKMTLKKINDISISQNLLTNVYTIFCDHNVFGDYATKERALEVLDEIQEKLLKSQVNFVKNGLNELVNSFSNNLCIYEMPKE